MWTFTRCAMLLQRKAKHKQQILPFNGHPEGILTAPLCLADWPIQFLSKNPWLCIGIGSKQAKAPTQHALTQA